MANPKKSGEKTGGQKSGKPFDLEKILKATLLALQRQQRSLSQSEKADRAPQPGSV